MTHSHPAKTQPKSDGFALVCLNDRFTFHFQGYTLSFAPSRPQRALYLRDGYLPLNSKRLQWRIPAHWTASAMIRGDEAKREDKKWLTQFCSGEPKQVWLVSVTAGRIWRLKLLLLFYTLIAKYDTITVQKFAHTIDSSHEHVKTYREARRPSRFTPSIPF